MALIIRTSASAIAHSKAAGLALLFIAILGACAAVVLFPLAGATGSMKILGIIALCFPAFGIIISIISLVAAIRKARRPVLVIDKNVVINGEIVCRVEDLRKVQIYGHGRTSFATLVTDQWEHTITFPEGAIPTPSQCAKLLRRDYPEITVSWLGSI